VNRLALRAELAKLEQLLDVEAGALSYLDRVPEAQLRHLRAAISEHLFDQDRTPFRRLARIASTVPTIAPWLARLIGPLLTARIVSEMPARRAAAIATRIAPAYAAEVCVHLDPRRARDLIQQIPAHFVVDIVRAMIDRRDYPTMGRFVDFLTDEAIQAVLVAIDDEAELLRIAFHMDSKNRLDRVVRMLPTERRRRIVLLALDDQRDLLDEILTVVASVNYALKRELGNLAAEQEEAVLGRIIQRAQDNGLWGDLLPIVASLSERHQRKVANLPILRTDPAVLVSLLQAADEHALWRSILPLVEMLDEGTRDAFARAGAQLPRAAIERAAQAVLIGELWEPMFDVVRRMPADKQTEFAEVLRGLAGHDTALDARLLTRARAYGLGDALASAGFAPGMIT
jgi:hypothetical protein